MRTTKVAISIDRETIEKLDKLVRDKVYPSRSRAIQEALEYKLSRLERIRLAKECAKLDPESEKVLADESLSDELAKWPEY